jgi:sirohydrochlorin cobaltochelatase
MNPALAPITSPSDDAAAILLCGHGSREPAAIDEFMQVFHDLRLRCPERRCAPGFLDLAQPDFVSALRGLHTAGARRVVVAPLLLTAGGHLRRDIPRLVQGVPDGVLQAGALGIHEGLLRAARERIDQATVAHGWSESRAATWLLVVGSGSDEAEANDTITTIGSRLVPDLGFGGGSTGFASGAGRPAHEALAQAIAHGFRQVLILPYFLFAGRLLQRVMQVLRHEADDSNLPIAVASHLGNHPGVLDALLERVVEAERCSVRERR